MQKRDRWASRLAEYLYGAQHQRFVYGSFDCCMFVAGAVLCQTGVDLGAGFRAKYGSKREADAMIGGDTDRVIGEFAGGVFADSGMPRIEPKHAQRGDVALVPLAGGKEALGVVDLNGVNVLVLLERGWGRFPLRRAKCAWAV